MRRGVRVMSGKSPLVFLSLVIMTGIYRAAITAAFPKTPSDFCDAPISEPAEGKSFGGSSGRITGKLEAIQIPIPAAPLRPEKSIAESGQGPIGRPFIEADLISAAIAGRTPQETRENVESFFSKFGLQILKYQDNDACGTVRLDFRKPEGITDTIQLSMAKREALRQIKELEEVKDLYPVNSYYRVIFSMN